MKYEAEYLLKRFLCVVFRNKSVISALWKCVIKGLMVLLRWLREFASSFMSRRTTAISFHRHGIHGEMRREQMRKSCHIQHRRMTSLFIFSMAL